MDEQTSLVAQDSRLYCPHCSSRNAKYISQKRYLCRTCNRYFKTI